MSPQGQRSRGLQAARHERRGSGSRMYLTPAPRPSLLYAGLCALGALCVLAVYVCDLVAWRLGHAVRKGVRNLLCAAPSGPCRQKVPDTFLSGPTDGPRCVTEDADGNPGAPGPSSTRMSPGPSGACESWGKAPLCPPSNCSCRGPGPRLQNRPNFGLPPGFPGSVGQISLAGQACRGWTAALPVVITGQGDFVQEYFG